MAADRGKRGGCIGVEQGQCDGFGDGLRALAAQRVGVGDLCRGICQLGTALGVMRALQADHRGAHGRAVAEGALGIDAAVGFGPGSADADRLQHARRAGAIAT